MFIKSRDSVITCPNNLLLETNQHISEDLRAPAQTNAKHMPVHILLHVD